MRCLRNSTARCEIGQLETKINFQNAVTFVLVKLDTNFNVQNS